MNTAPIPGSREISYLSISQEYLKSFSVTYIWIRRVVCDLWSDKPWCLDDFKVYIYIILLPYISYVSYCNSGHYVWFFCSIEVFSIHAD